MEFRCFDCNRIFEADGIREEYRDPIYGPCSRIVSDCPDCGSPCSEYRKPRQAKASGQQQESCPAYHSGSCSCCH